MERKKDSTRKGATSKWSDKAASGHSPFKKTRGHTGNKKVNIPKFEESIRLNKYLANAGICSRREADTLILSGAIHVNGVAVTELGVKVNPDKDNVKYGGQSLSLESKRYVLLNKPKDFVSNINDLGHKRSVLGLVSSACKEALYPVGQLDRHSTGLLLLTNDGDLEKKLVHPKINVRSMYHVSLRKTMSETQLNLLRTEGIRFGAKVFKPEAVEFVQNDTTGKEVGIEIKSGRSALLKSVFEYFDNEIVKLDRVSYAGLTKKDIPRGKYRMLKAQEIQNLKNL